ncbi:expression site-associated gene 4 (ESAG4) protein, putative [Trypanosoma brucei brucei TREU927]|uniref:adenylate cyclase n=2 Tax=Trypanosoma brucei TaxID=5691 RepID=Q38CU7_TRYB2|nr:expression site-associated protein [Trypanosoma brucei brucei TREU927]EAN77373.1 expression site-associated gene 4 (ESAG4) protein, putative [Trypanosoma brucei brucei TREU927]
MSCLRSISLSVPPHALSTFSRTGMLYVMYVLLLLMPYPLQVHGAPANINVKVLLCTWNTRVPKIFTTAVNAGFNASMESRNWTIADRVKVQVVQSSTSHKTPEEFIKDELSKETDKSGITIVFGPVGDDTTLDSISELQKHEVVAFGPMTGSGEVRRWVRELYFLRPSPTIETMVLIRHALGHLGVLRLGFMYLQGHHYGEKEYEVALRVMEEMGYQLCGVFVVLNVNDKPAPDKEFNAVFERFAATKPQAVLLFGAPKSDTGRFLRKLVADRRTSGAYVLAPSGAQVFLELMWKRVLLDSQVSPFPGKLLIAGTNPLAKNEQYVAIKRFQEVMREYLKTHTSETGITDPNYFLKHDTDGEMMVYGWAAGEVLSQALSVPEWLKDRTTFMDSLYNQRRYVIADFVIGDFGGDCEGEAAKQGAVCYCNQGGNVVYVREVEDDFSMQTPKDGTVGLAALRCNADSVTLHSPLNGLVIFFGDNTIAVKATAAWLVGALRHDTGSLEYSGQLFLHAFGTTTSDSAKALKEEKKKRTVTAVFGIVTKALMKMTNTLFIDPITIEPQLNKFRRHVIHLSPTVEQQIYVLTRYLSNNSGKEANAIVCAAEAHGIMKVIRKSLEKWGGSLNISLVRRRGAALTGHLPTSGAVFVFGISAADVDVIERHLAAHSELRVLVLFSEVALLYEKFVTAFNGSAAAPRLVFATNLPHWYDNETSSPTILKFHATVESREKWTPMTLMGFVTGTLMSLALLRVERVNMSTLANFFFVESSVNVDDMRYGVFSDSECGSGETGYGDMCRTNYGATRISVWSMSRVFNASIELLAEPVTPSLKFLLEWDGLTRAQLVGIIVGSTLFVMLLAALGVFMHITLRDARDNVSAPMDPTDPVTLIFTDIENSTSQWASHPNVMADAVAAHHSLIRTLIGNYDCYEVKTIGDSFMIASKSATAAVRLARDLQRCFLNYRWGTDSIDNFYRAEEKQVAELNSKAEPPSAQLDPEVYRKLWNGLRIRAGIHTGLCDIRYDEVTKGYDYYGQTANMAARTESIANGGQVLLTRATYFSLSTAEREQLDVTALGSVPLRGVPEPVEIYQLDAVPGRTFAPLRLDHEAYVADESSDVSHTTFNDCMSISSQLGAGGESVSNVLHALLGTFTIVQRQKELTAICERWRVPLPPWKEAVWNDEYYQEAIHRLAVKVGHIVDVAAVERVGRPTESSDSSSVILISNPAVDQSTEDLEGDAFECGWEEKGKQ